jgi:hypothetical protein
VVLTPTTTPRYFTFLSHPATTTADNTQKLQAFLEHVMESEIVLDGTLADNQTQIRELWSWREGITEVLGHEGGVYKYDLSIPISELYDLVNDTRDRLTEAGLVGDTPDHPVVDVVGYGHMGDANLHLNIPTRGFSKDVEKALEPFVYEWVQKRNGSISAEHGLGVTKKPYVGYSKDETMMRLMRQIKDLYDPVSGYHLSCVTCANTPTEGYHEPLQVHINRALAIYHISSSPTLSRCHPIPPTPPPHHQNHRQKTRPNPPINPLPLPLIKKLLHPLLHSLRKLFHERSPREGKIAAVQQPLVAEGEAVDEGF